MLSLQLPPRPLFDVIFRFNVWFFRGCFSQITPKISATEAAALEAGTIGFDRDLFNGTASLDGLKKKYPLVSLNEREQKFIDNEVSFFFPAIVPPSQKLFSRACRRLFWLSLAFVVGAARAAFVFFCVDFGGFAPRCYLIHGWASFFCTANAKNADDGKLELPWLVAVAMHAQF